MHVILWILIKKDNQVTEATKEMPLNCSLSESGPEVTDHHVTIMFSFSSKLKRYIKSFTWCNETKKKKDNQYGMKWQKTQTQMHIIQQLWQTELWLTERMAFSRDYQPQPAGYIKLLALAPN